MQVTAVVPLKGFSAAKGRLSPGLAEEARFRLSAATAERVVTACRDAGLPTRVVTDDAAVAELAARLGAEEVRDPGSGLNAAAKAGLAGFDDWIVVHGDLPLLDAATLIAIAAGVQRGDWILAPARDGGTNVLGGHGDFEPAYGPGSFHRHLARVARYPHRVVVSAVTAVEIDTPSDLSAAARLDGGEWLEPFLS